MIRCRRGASVADCRGSDGLNLTTDLQSRVQLLAFFLNVVWHGDLPDLLVLGGRVKSGSGIFATAFILFIDNSIFLGHRYLDGVR